MIVAQCRWLRVTRITVRLWSTGLRPFEMSEESTEILGLATEEERHRRLVELNILEGCLSVFKTPVVQRKRVETHEDPAYPFTMPRIHPLVYDPGLGRLERLNFNLEAYLEEYGNIYDMCGKGGEAL